MWRKTFIFKNITQHFMLQHSLSLEAGAIFDCLISCYEQQDFYETREADDKLYIWITPNNLIKRLPILELTEAKVKRYFKYFETLKLVELRKFGTLQCFYISTNTMFDAASDEFFKYNLKDPERSLSVVKKIRYVFNYGFG